MNDVNEGQWNARLVVERKRTRKRRRMRRDVMRCDANETCVRVKERNAGKTVRGQLRRL